MFEERFGHHTMESRTQQDGRNENKCKVEEKGEGQNIRAFSDQGVVMSSCETYFCIVFKDAGYGEFNFF